MDKVMGTWLDLRLAAVRKAESGGASAGVRQGGANQANHLITVGHNAERALLPSNRHLDFVSHHSYASDQPATNRRCCYYYCYCY
jgi:hypothetical protein